MPLSPDQRQRLELNRLVNALMQADFDSLIFTLSVPQSVIPPGAAAQGNRSGPLLQWVEGPTGCGMDAFLSVLGEIVPLTSDIKASAQEIKSRELKTASPYRGLEPFTSENKANFFGRSRWIQNLVTLLNQHDSLLLHGPSGSGKSSLIGAGVIPRLEEDAAFYGLVKLVFTPGKNPFKWWSRSLEQVDRDRAEDFEQSDPNMLWQAVQELQQGDTGSAEASPRPWLIFIDQFEELFTQTVDKHKRDTFFEALNWLLDQCKAAELSSVKLIMTMRSDFLGHLSDYPEFVERIETTTKLLTRMKQEELEAAIVQPAANHGVVFESGLVEQISREFFGQAGSLPLLQYMLNVLWTPEAIADRELTQKAYEAIGGLTFALNQQANRVWEQFTEEQRQAAEQIFVQLVEVEGSEPVRRRVSRADLGYGNDSGKMLPSLAEIIASQ